MSREPQFFWSPPDGAPIVGVTMWRDRVVVATASGIYVIVDGLRADMNDWTVHKISAAVRRNEPIDEG